MQIRKVMTSYGVQLKLQNTEWTLSLEILKQCFSNLAPEIFITQDTKRHLLCCCHDNNSASGPVLIKTTIPSFCLNKGPSTPVNLMMTDESYDNMATQPRSQGFSLYLQGKSPGNEVDGYHVCYKGLKMRTFGFWQKETGAKRVSMTTTLWLLFSFFCDAHFWCQVWRTLLLHFQRCSWLQPTEG